MRQAADYSLTALKQAATVTPLPVKLMGSRNYDGTTTANASTLTVSNEVSGDNLTLSGSVTLAGKDAGSQNITAFTGLTLGGTSAADYTLTGATGSVTVNVLPVTLSGSRYYDGTTTANASTLKVSNEVSGDNLTLSGSVTLAGKDAGSQNITAFTGLTLGGTSAADYTLTGATGSATINVLPVTLSGSRNYDGTTTANASILKVSNEVTGDNLMLSGSVTLAGKAPGSENITSFSGLTLGGTPAADYTFTGATGSVTINALPVTLSGSRNYDGTTTADASILAITNKVGSDNLTLSGSVTLAGSSPGNQNITSFNALTLGGNSAADYTLTGATGSVTIQAINASLSGYVYLDPGNSGSRTAGDMGMGGVTVNLIATQGGGSNQSTTTGSDGSYSFSGLKAGTYEIRETPPPKFLDGSATPGSLGGGSSANTISGIQVGAGQQGTGYDFGHPGLRLTAISLRLFLASTPSGEGMYSMLDDPPTVQTGSSPGETYNTVFTAGGSAVAVVDPKGSVTASGTGSISSLTVTIANLEDGSSESLSAVTNGSEITQHYANGVLTLSGADTAADYTTVLQSVTYTDNATSPTLGTRTLTFVASNGLVQSSPAITSIAVQADPPAVTQSTAKAAMTKSTPRRSRPKARSPPSTRS